MFSALQKTSVILGLQAIVALAFLLLLVKVNITVSTAENRLTTEQKRAEVLDHILDSVNALVTLTDTSITKIVPAKKTVGKKDSLQKVKATPSKTVGYDSVARNMNNPRNADQALPVLTNPAPASSAITRYTYQFPSRLFVNSSVITEIAGDLLIKKNNGGIPEEIKLTTRFKEFNEDDGSSAILKFNSIKTFISNDSSVNCIYRENPQAVTDQFGYQRRLTFSITGSLKNKSLDARLDWYELSGRPAYVIFKVKIDQP